MNKLNILIIGYNRIEYLNTLLKAVPFPLLGKAIISLDGPKNNIIDRYKVRKVQDLAMQWGREYTNITLNFNKVNLGCRLHVQNALNLFFEKNDSGAILEDDCIPSFSFFHFMSYALEKYKNTNDILTVSGSNLFSDNFQSHKNMICSKYPHSWGWATWKNRLIEYDPLLSMSTTASDKIFLKKTFSSSATENFWVDKFSKIRDGSIDTWDYQLVHLSLYKASKNLVSPKNLITNIGFGIRSTHTKNVFSRFSKLEKSEIDLPIPENFNDILNSEYDALFEKFVCKL